MNKGTFILNVAEKPSVAKSIVNILTKGTFTYADSSSKYNNIFSFPYKMNAENVTMLFTSVSGHIMGLDFPAECKNWKGFPLLDLFDYPIVKNKKQDYAGIFSNLSKYSKIAKILILWTDCDREGEAIALEIQDFCQKENSHIICKRAHYSAIAYANITSAIIKAGSVNINLAESVFLRQELDLRIGSMVTRFQTLTIQDIFKGEKGPMISYGPCQIPTLAFVVMREISIQKFKSEEFYYLECIHKDDKNQITVFSWDRNKLFNGRAALSLARVCFKVGQAKVLSCRKFEIKKYRPIALNSVKMEKLAAHHLRFSSQHTMEVAERLYNASIISYPRTETDTFEGYAINLKELVESQTKSTSWGSYASKILCMGIINARNGKGNDFSHPPIHPLKFVDISELKDKNDWQLYELIARHFLACVSKDAVGFKTDVRINIGFENFHANGIQVLEKNYLEIYKYEKWTGSLIGDYKEGQIFVPNELNIKTGNTAPPKKLAEEDLIGLMDKNGIGTDATIHEHIKTIQQRGYAYKENNVFIPTKLGSTLIEAYISMKTQIFFPNIRAAMEKDMKEVSEGKKSKKVVLNSCITQMKEHATYILNNKEIFIAVFKSKFQALSEINSIVSSSSLTYSTKRKSFELQNKKKKNSGPNADDNDDGGPKKKRIMKVCPHCGKCRHPKDSKCPGNVKK